LSQNEERMMVASRVLNMVAFAAAAFLAVSSDGRALDLGDTVRSATRSVSGGGAGGTSASVGSGQTGGLKAGVKSGLLDGTNVEVDLLGESSAASVDGESAGPTTKAGAGILSRGQLISLGLDPDASFAATGAGSVNAAFAKSLLAGMSRIEAQAFKLKCRDILRSPKAFDAELILLCRIVASL
jgi:hypothetical protein